RWGGVTRCVRPAGLSATDRASSDMRSRRSGAFASVISTSNSATERPCWARSPSSSARRTRVAARRVPCQASNSSGCKYCGLALARFAMLKYTFLRKENSTPSRCAMYAQIVTFQESPEQVDAGIAHVLDDVIPALEHAPGLTGVWLADRAKGKRLSIMVWESEAAASAAMAEVQKR